MGFIHTAEKGICPKLLPCTRKVQLYSFQTNCTGASPDDCKHATLFFTRRWTVGQFNWNRTCEMYSHSSVPVMRHAVAF